VRRAGLGSSDLGRGDGTTPEKMRAQMESAGFLLERVDKSLEANELYIYLFRLEAR
jgi:hypothetical protein